MTDADEGDPGAPATKAIEPNEPGEPTPFRINASLAPAYRGETTRMLSDVRAWLAEGWRVVLVTEGHGPAHRLAEMLRGEDIGARLHDDVAELPEPGVPYVTTARLGNGFVWPDVRLALLTESDLAGTPAGLPTTRDMRRMPSRRRGGVDPLQLKSRRLRGARAARRGPVRRDDLADHGRRHPRIPGDRVRAGPARAAGRTGSTCRPTSSTR